MDYGTIVDVETTGLDCSVDKIIEIGIIQFGLSGADMKPFITATYGGLEDPGEEVSTEIEKLTGIQNAHLANTKIEWGLVKSMLAKSKVVIAHNAEFDRGFLASRPEIANEVEDAHWACSLRHIDWAGKGYRSLQLGHLAADHGFINPFPHRALFDCATTLSLITPYMSELIKKSYERRYRIFAVNSPFEKKDELKAKSYRWDAERRVWFKEVFESTLEEETDFLKENIYNGQSMHQLTEITDF